MKKIIALALVALLAMGTAFAQRPQDKPTRDKEEKMERNTDLRPRDGKHHHHPGGPHHTPPQKPAETQYNADGIDMAIVRAFPDVKSINKTKKWTEVLNADGKLLGYAVYSKPASDGIKGYNGETPVLIALSKKKVIIGVWLLPNSETPRFTKRVEDAGFYNNWNGLSIKKARKKKVDAVSGATFTSRAVAESVQAALKAL